MDKLNITVIGFGNVGSTLTFLLLEHERPLRINVMQNSNHKDGSILDMKHSMSLHPDKEFHVNNKELFNEADFIFYAAGIQNIHGESRLTTAKKNRDLTREIFCNQVFKNNPHIIVISNPVDLITSTLQEVCSLPPMRVLGTGTYLDSIRLSYYLSELSGFAPHEFEAWVLGEHGDSQVPIYSMTKLNNSPIREQKLFTEELLLNAEELTRNAAFQIRETQSGTMYGVSACAVNIMNALLSDKSTLLPLSVMTNSFFTDLLEINTPISISIPIEVSNRGLKYVEHHGFNDSEITALRASAAIILSMK